MIDRSVNAVTGNKDYDPEMHPLLLDEREHEA